MPSFFQLRKIKLPLAVGLAIAGYAGVASANFDQWRIGEVFSNSDGTVQFLELKTTFENQDSLSGVVVRTEDSVTGVVQEVSFASDLIGDTRNQTLLLATKAFVDNSGLEADFQIPAGFLPLSAGTVTFANSIDTLIYEQGTLPLNGIQSIDEQGQPVTASPKNFSGLVASLSEPVNAYFDDVTGILTVPVVEIPGNELVSVSFIVNPETLQFTLRDDFYFYGPNITSGDGAANFSDRSMLYIPRLISGIELYEINLSLLGDTPMVFGNPEIYSLRLVSPESTSHPEPEPESETETVSNVFSIETFAGFGPPDVGDGGPATDASLEQPTGVLAAADGSFYVVDTYNNRIRLVTNDGTITTIAGIGSGETRDFGDGLPATEAQLRLPRSVKFAPDGTLWIVDTNNYRIRRIGANGIMETVAGGGGAVSNPTDDVPALGAEFAGPMDIEFDTDGNYYIADMSANRIRRVGQDGIIRTFAQVNQPQSLAWDGRGGLIIASGGASVQPLRRLDVATGTVSSIDNALGRYVTVDESGNIYFANGQVYRLDANTGEVTLVAGKSGPAGFDGDGGLANGASLNNPARLSIGPAGALYIADSGNNRIRRVDSNGLITTVAGRDWNIREDFPAEQAVIYDSQGIAIDSRGNVFFTDFLHRTIRKVDEEGIVSTIAGIPPGLAQDVSDDIHPLDAWIGTPSKILFDHQDNLLILDQEGSVGVVRIITTGMDGVVDGSPDERIRTIAGQYRPRDEADRGLADGGPAREAVFDAARSIALDSQGRLYIADNFDHRIRMVVPGSDGVFNGDSNEVITTVAGTGTALSSGDGGPASKASLFLPGAYNLTVDAQDNIYFIENARRIRRIDQQTGIIDTVWDNRGYIWSIEFDPFGWAYVTNSANIYRFQPDNASVIEVVAGTGEFGFSGDGGPATQAELRGAQFLAIDSRGDVYFPDNGNFRIRWLRRLAP